MLRGALGMFRYIKEKIESAWDAFREKDRQKWSEEGYQNGFRQGEGRTFDSLLAIIKKIRSIRKNCTLAYIFLFILSVYFIKSNNISEEEFIYTAMRLTFSAFPFILTLILKKMVRREIVKYCPNVGKDVQKAMSQPLAAAHNAVEAGLVFYCWNPIMRIQWTASLQNLYSYFF